MQEILCAHTYWKVKPGREDDFLLTWQGLADIFSSLANPPLWGTVIQGIKDPSIFYSIGLWGSHEDIAAMRADPRVRKILRKARSLCLEITAANMVADVTA
ncbi:MAG TPA: hypothetical protein VGL38_08910 [bacterium]|jgi:heme-degrading monooxygenase HmoA